MKETITVKVALIILVFSLFGIILSYLVLAHEESGESRTLFSNPSTYIIISGIWIVLLIFFFLAGGENFALNNKKLFFCLMITPIILSSFYLAGYTIYENLISETRGPVHWHADYEVYACEERLDLINPRLQNNKVGDSLLHEHNDDRIHIEGTIVNLDDVTLGEYFERIGGELKSGLLKYPTDKGVITAIDGDKCNKEKGKLKVYVNGKKIDDFANYLIYPDSNVPPGDCIIIIFDEKNSAKTDILCQSWQVNGWNYDNFQRREVRIGNRVWQ